MQIKSCVFTQKTLYWKAVTEKYLLFWEKYHIEMSALHKKLNCLRLYLNVVAKIKLHEINSTLCWSCQV